MENSPTDSAKKDIQPPSTSSTDQAKSSPPKTDIEVVAHTESSSTNTIDASTTDTNLPPPPRPASNAGNSSNNNATNTNTNTTTTSDTYFAANQAATSHLSFEPNPFEHSFAGGGSAAETPGGTKLPPVASITSPASLLPNGTTTPYPWGTSSLRTGPLSPAMLSGPTGDYFSDTNHLRGGFTPNESSLRTGLTPGGGGSMFPAPSPTSQALFSQLAGGATPSTLDFHRTALSAAAQRKRSDPQLPNITSQPQQQQQDTNGEQIRQIQREPFAQHDANDAANGLFLLASQSRTNSASAGGQYAMAPQQPVHAHPSSSQQQQQQAQDHRNGGGRALSEASDESERASRPNTRGKGRKSASARRKAEEPAAKAPPSKKGKGSSGQHHYMEPEPPSEEEDVKQEEYNANGKKMTDEEKRKNFLERNRVAALKCRQRKKQWLANLQSKVEIFSSENDALSTQISALREEVVALKTLLLAHKDCPVTQSQAMGGYLGSVEFGGMPPGVGVQNVQYGMMPQGMGSGMGSVGQQQQQVMAGQGGDRRFS